MNHRILAIATCTLAILPAVSQIVHTQTPDTYFNKLYLNDGSKIEGFVSLENLASDSIEVIAYTTEVTVPLNKISFENYQKLRSDDLDDIEREWLARNPIPGNGSVGTAEIADKTMLKKQGDYRTRNLTADILDDDFQPTGEPGMSYPMLITEYGDIITYVDLNKHKYNLTWKDIERIEYPVKGYNNALFLDYIVYKDNELLQGEIITNVTGDYRKILLEDGTVQNIDFANTLAIGKRSNIPDNSLLQTAPLFATIIFENGEESSPGVIQKDNSNAGEIEFLALVPETGKSSYATYTYDEVASVSYTPNPERITSRPARKSTTPKAKTKPEARTKSKR